jgi:hypothetical protein
VHSDKDPLLWLKKCGSGIVEVNNKVTREKQGRGRERGDGREEREERRERREEREGRERERERGRERMYHSW